MKRHECHGPTRQRRLDHQHLSGIFANKHLDMKQRFLATKWSTGRSDAPTMDEAMVGFDCRISEIRGAGGHSILYPVTRPVLHGPAGTPLKLAI